MKMKYVLGMLVILIAATTACVYATECAIGDYTFTVPEGYTTDENGGEIVSIYCADDKSIIALTIGKASYLKSDAISNKINDLESKGYKVPGNRTFQYDGKDIIEIDYENSEAQYNQYMWQGDSDDCIIAVYSYPLKDSKVEFEDSPMKTVVDTLAKK